MIPNRGVNIGHSSRLGYDKATYNDRLEESTSPLMYNLNPNQINNCEACLSVFGPRGGHNGYGDSTLVGHTTAPAQDLVDLESILSNRNVIASKAKDAKVNDIDVTKFRAKNAAVCSNYLDPIATHLTNPPQNYREMGINRFYDLTTNMQANIFYPFAVNTRLEAKDNYIERLPRLQISDPTLPRELRGKNTSPWV
jgi:hypothetical protein